MKKRNIYKDVVAIAIGCIITALAVQAINFWMRQQKSYEIIIRSQEELTEADVKEMGKIEGLYRFTPAFSCQVTLRLEEYSLEAMLEGVESDGYPLAWKLVQDEMRLGNSPVLFFGKEVFASFTDSNGNGPGKSRIARWLEGYQDLELAVADGDGRERAGKIGGILESPASGIYMDEGQLQGIYGEDAKMTGGCVKLQGYRNMKRAQEILSGAGLQVGLVER